MLGLYSDIMKEDIEIFKLWYKSNYNRSLSTQESIVKLQNLEIFINVLMEREEILESLIDRGIK